MQGFFQFQLFEPMNVDDLPICAYRSQILETIKSSAVTIIRGPTGCGKSTFIPILLAKHYRIAVVEPRRIAVLSLYESIKTHCDAGYKIRFSKKNTSARVCIFTDGMFLNEKWDFDMVVVDEVHERTVRTDAILSILKKRLCESALGKSDGGCTERRVARALLMSATVDTDALERYFSASLLEIQCKTFPLNVFYEERPVADYVLASFVKVKEILRESRNAARRGKALSAEAKCGEESGSGASRRSANLTAGHGEAQEKESPRCEDVLVFLPGEEDINDLHALLQGILDINVLRIHSTLSDRDQQAIFAPSSLRKVILSTNICETSLTIPGVGFVIDCGLQKVKMHEALSSRILSKEKTPGTQCRQEDEGFCYVSLMGIVPVSKESAEQRAGRANRTGTGTVYRLYTEESYRGLKRPVPEIRTADLRTVLLYLIDHGVDILNLNMIDMPSRRNFRAALSFLLCMEFIEISYVHTADRDEIDDIFGAVRNENDEVGTACGDVSIAITMLGKKMLRYPLDVHLAYFFDLCCRAGVQDTGAMLVSLISLDNYNFLQKGSGNDIQDLLQLFKSYLLGDVHMKGLDKARKIYMQLRAENKSQEGVVEAVFSQAFQYNLSTRQGNGSYRHEQSGMLFHAKSNEKRIVFVDLVCINRTYARIVGRYCSE